MRTIKLMADYFCHPLWDRTPGRGGDRDPNIDPDELPISEELKNRLTNWAKNFDAILNMDDPASSGFPSKDDELRFSQQGAKLAESLRAELGSEFRIIEYSGHTTSD
jgi:hypothetical protein